MPNNPLRNIPSVSELLENPALKGLVDKVSHNVVVSEVRTFLDDLRGELKQRATEVKIPAASELAERIADWIVTDQRPRLRPVINATGILLHTGLGRSPLASSAIREMTAVAAGYASLEVDLETNERSQRAKSVEKILIELTGAEAAFVVNNNAGATLLALAATAKGREVIVSRGHLVEIGGSYRLPDVMELSGAKLREVGTTNKTRLEDFASAVTDETGALMRVHPSNYVINGFTHQPTLKELVRLGKEHGLPVIDDIGSGALIDFAAFGLAGEPCVRDSIQADADLALFSGDKLLGGPQCGIVVGKRERIDALVRHPLARALRVGKLTLAALAATLRLYREPDKAKQEIPLLRLVSTSVENLRNRAERLAPQLRCWDELESVDVVEDHAYLGGGSVPTQQVPTVCLALKPRSMSVDELARELRTGQPSIYGRIQKERLLLDLRTVFPEQDSQLLERTSVSTT